MENHSLSRSSLSPGSSSQASTSKPEGSNYPANNRGIQKPLNQQRPNQSQPMGRNHVVTSRHHPVEFRHKNYVVELIFHPNENRSNPRPTHAELEDLISDTGMETDGFYINEGGEIAAYFCFTKWPPALSALSSLWEFCFRGVLRYMPRMVFNCNNASANNAAKAEHGKKLQNIFFHNVDWRLHYGGSQSESQLQKKIDKLNDQLHSLQETMRKKHGLKDFHQLGESQTSLQKQIHLMKRRIFEYHAALRCFWNYLQEDVWERVEEHPQVLRLTGEYNWFQIYRLLLREERRLSDQLPIYSHRREILTQIIDQRVMVLIGETGSGKSTQLVQYLADSGLGGSGSIVCTQPRKIAAISLTERVKEETNGCSGKRSVLFCPTFTGNRRFEAKMVFMTDNCLLQHYLNDTDLSGISCIVIDEAHERSLNTDLLLALVKDLLYRRGDLRLIIMSATANAEQLSSYFLNSKIIYVSGRNFPVEIKYVPSVGNALSFSSGIAAYAYDVVKMAKVVHTTENQGTILAFLTSQTEVEWACEKFGSPESAVVLPLHGKLTVEDQLRVFKAYPGKRKVIFSTNVAETSLTIRGVKYVIDSGFVKESKFEAGSGMNVLKVCRISQSSAKQRAGRAGRTEAGRCYRLYPESEFEAMSLNQEPEIHRIHLGIAVLRILSLGIKNVKDFDFVDAPSPKAIDMATRNLLQLGAITQKTGELELTEDGKYIVKLGIEPRLGKLLLSCFDYQLVKEGIVLAALTANASCIFCRVGNDDEKQKADCLKVQFCDQNGDLFTLLSVYREWEAMPAHTRNQWCWDNSINAKSMRRCHDTIKELEICIYRELNNVVPNKWVWNPHQCSAHDKTLKKVILSCLAENVAMYCGNDQLGYEVASTGQLIQLHPSCSLHAFAQRPSWVVFGEILSFTNQYLVCVTAFDFDCLATLDPPPLFDVYMMESRRLQVKVMTGLGCTLLKKLCGKSTSNLISLVSHARSICTDERVDVKVNIDLNEVLVFATSDNMEKVVGLVNDALEYERKQLRNECMEKSLYHGPDGTPFALFGSGAEIKHLEVDKRYLTIDIAQWDTKDIGEKELLMFLEESTCGTICSINKWTSTTIEGQWDKWGTVTFACPDAAERAAELYEVHFNESLLRLLPSSGTFGGDRSYSFPAVKAKISWARRRSRGFAIVVCKNIFDVDFMMEDFSNLFIGGAPVWCERSIKSEDSIVLRGLDKEITEMEIQDALATATKRKMSWFLVRGDPVLDPPIPSSEETLLREICKYMPKQNGSCRVQIFPPEQHDCFTKAMISFDGKLHLEAATALEELDGKVLPGLLSWQKIKCQHLFHTSLTCPASVYRAIQKQLELLVANFNRQPGVNCNIERLQNGSQRVKISAGGTKKVADLRRPLEDLMIGKFIDHASLSPTILQHLFSKEGIELMKSIQTETQTYIMFDRHNFKIRVFGSRENSAASQEKLMQSLLEHHEKKLLDIPLRGTNRPPDLMKKVVKRFGPDLRGLKEQVPGVELYLNVRQHKIGFLQGDRDLKKRVEDIIYGIFETDISERHEDAAACPICLCEVEDGYQLEDCLHLFCKSCLLDQCESAIRNRDGFPICCAHEGCSSPILLRDLHILLSLEKLDELFRASVSAFVTSSGGGFRFCSSPDCHSVYQTVPYDTVSPPFVCGSCYVETCRSCYMEYHPYFTCQHYKEFKADPDHSLKEWCLARAYVKKCPSCGITIEKGDGCDHVECRCGKHICWVCLMVFEDGGECYQHTTNAHLENYM